MLVLKVSIAGLLLLAAVHDFITRTVPNWMPVLLALFCICIATFDLNFIWGLGFGFAVFLLSLFCWWRGWMGGADVKLLGSAAIAVAPSAAGTFLLAVTLSGGILALVYLAARFVLPPPAPRPPVGLVPRILRVETRRIRNRGPLPYACAIAAGTIFVLS